MINIEKKNVQVCRLEENESVLGEKKWRDGDILIHIFEKFDELISFSKKVISFRDRKTADPLIKIGI